MIYSMTGFGRAELSESDKKFTVEIKSVNHKYFDLNIRMRWKSEYSLHGSFPLQYDRCR